MVPESIPSRFSDSLSVENLDKKCRDYASGINNGNETVLSLVEKLGSNMTSSEEDARCYATALLSGVIEKLVVIRPDEASHLANYFCSRLDDRSLFIPFALDGLTALVRKGGGETTASLALSALEEHIQTQSLAQADRRRVYLLYSAIVDHSLSYAVKLGDEFIRRLCTHMDGESDPRNLILLFTLLPRTLPLFSITPSTADLLFSVLECYFPVDFTPSSKYAITREELSNGLESCLSSSAQLVPYCIPLAIEKIESGLKVALLDALSLVRRVVQFWGGQSLGGECSRLGELWDSLRLPLLETGDNEVATACVSTISLCMDAASSGGCVLPAADNIIQYLKVLIRDPAKEIPFSRTCQLYGAAAISNQYLAKALLPHAISAMTSLFKTERVYKLTVLFGFEHLLHAASAHPPPCEEVEEAISTLVSSIAQDEKVIPSDVVEARWRCLSASIPIIPEKQRKQLLSYFVKDIPEHSVEELEVLAKLSHSYSDEVKQEVLDKLNLGGDLAVAVCCCKVPVLTECSSKLIITSLNNPNTLQETIIALRHLTESCSAEILKKMENGCKLITCLLRVSESLSLDRCSDLAICIKNIFRHLSLRDQEKLLYEWLPVYFSDLSDISSGLICNKIISVEGLLGALREELAHKNEIIQLTSLIISKFLSSNDSLSESTLNSSNKISNTDYSISDFAGRLVASIVNKLTAGNELDTILQMVSLQHCSVAHIHLFSWITKALVMRGHPNFKEYLEKLLSLLNDSALAFEAANGFKIILFDEPHFLNQSCHCIVRLLYKQRVFSIMTGLSRIMEGPSGSDPAYLVLAHLIHYCPPQLINSSLKLVMRHVAICLETSDSQVIGPVLETVSSMIPNAPQIFLQHIDTFIPACLRLLMSKPSPSMKVRVAAVNCLLHYSSLPDSTYLLPYKDKVIRGLTSLLNDPKRIVRKQVVRARCSWYLLGSL